MHLKGPGKASALPEDLWNEIENESEGQLNFTFFVKFQGTYNRRGMIRMTEFRVKEKKIESKYIYRGCCAIILIIFASAMFFANWYEFVQVNNATGHLTGYGNLLMALFIYALAFMLVGKGLRAFKIGVDRQTNIIASLVLTVFTVDVIEIPLSMAITGQFRFFFDFLLRYLVLGVGQAVLLSMFSIPMVRIYRGKYAPLKMIEIYGEYVNGLCAKVNSRADKYHIVKMVSCEEPESKIKAEIMKYDAVLINDLPSHMQNKILKLCFDMDKRVYFTPKISDIIVKSSDELNLFDTPLYLCRNVGISWMQAAVKRFFDILLSGLALLLLSPVLLITALAIKLNDGGPVFYKQERCTIGGSHFMILKFRSMIVDAEKDGKSHPAGENDDRITKVGHVIRACRIDELPQLINILKGEMSIVGPRPERVEHVEKYTADIPEFRFRMKVKGGLTGYAQVYGKYNTTALDKLKLDLYYIMNYSLLLDVQIIFETVKILFQKESTEGFSEERVAKIQERI